MTNSGSMVDNPYYQARFQDYFALLKSRVMSLVIFTAFVGMVVSIQSVSFSNLLLHSVSLIAIAVGAGASGALNMAYDADIDAVMTRTQKRPIPQGVISVETARDFGLFLSVFSVILLALSSNVLDASLLAFTIFFYAVVYTMWLKRSTPQNIVIGGLAGALPPVIGDAALNGTIGGYSALLCLIIFMWTPPHFWALSLLKSEDYRKAGIPMLPNVSGISITKIHTLFYHFLLMIAVFLPVIFGYAGGLYSAVSATLGGLMTFFCVRLYFTDQTEKLKYYAGRVFGVSILFLFVLFLAVFFEKVLAF